MPEINNNRYKVLRALHLKEIATLYNIMINEKELPDFCIENIKTPFNDKTYIIKYDKVFTGQINISCSDNRELELCIYNGDFNSKIFCIYIALKTKEGDEYIDFKIKLAAPLTFEVDARTLQRNITPPEYSKYKSDNSGQDYRDNVEDIQLDWNMAFDRSLYLVKNATFTKEELEFIINVIQEEIPFLTYASGKNPKRVRTNKEDKKD